VIVIDTAARQAGAGFAEEDVVGVRWDRRTWRAGTAELRHRTLTSGSLVSSSRPRPTSTNAPEVSRVAE
jgi:hypothetical protein